MAQLPRSQFVLLEGPDRPSPAPPNAVTPGEPDAPPFPLVHAVGIDIAASNVGATSCLFWPDGSVFEVLEERAWQVKAYDKSVKRFAQFDLFDDLWRWVCDSFPLAAARASALGLPFYSIVATEDTQFGVAGNAATHWVNGPLCYELYKLSLRPMVWPDRPVYSSVAAVCVSPSRWRSFHRIPSKSKGAAKLEAYREAAAFRGFESQQSAKRPREDCTAAFLLSSLAAVSYPHVDKAADPARYPMALNLYRDDKAWLSRLPRVSCFAPWTPKMGWDELARELSRDSSGLLRESARSALLPGGTA